jgi:hypothetical protein
MSRTRTRKFLTVAALLGVALGALAVGAPSAASLVADEEDKAYAAPANGLSGCRGGAQLASLSQQNDTPWTFGETVNPIILPGSGIPLAVPAGESRLIEVWFDAEARLQGQPNTFVTPADFMRVVIFLDGVPMPPDDDAMFTTDIGQSVSTQACRRVGPGNHLVNVGFQLIDQGAASVLTGTVDDWMNRVHIVA